MNECVSLADTGWRLAQCSTLGTAGLVKGTHALGLGKKPNCIPPGRVGRCDPRPVMLGCKPVPIVGKWLSDKKGIGKLITQGVDNLADSPDPTQHWAILVGDYVHELWMVRWPFAPPSQTPTAKVWCDAVCVCGWLTFRQDENFDIIYMNEPIKKSGKWQTFDVGATMFNDEAVREAGASRLLLTMN
jgi:hypothetical protein